MRRKEPIARPAKGGAMWLAVNIINAPAPKLIAVRAENHPDPLLEPQPDRFGILVLHVGTSHQRRRSADAPENGRKVGLRVNTKLMVEPDVFHAPAIVDAVDHDGQPFDLGVPADAAAVEVDQRLGVVLGQPPLDLPDEPLALFLVRFDRLPLDHRVNLGVAMAIGITDPATRVIYIKHG